MRVIFFGTPNFAADVLEYLIANDINVVSVITKPDRPKGRSGIPVPTPVKVIAQKHSIPFYQPELVSNPDFAPTLAQYKPDLFVVVAYGEIIKQHLLDMPTLGCINLHASLLPLYRGAAPIQRSIINGEAITGVTIMYMVKKMDAGDMIKQVVIPIEPDDQFPRIEQELCRVGSKALLDVIRAFQSGKVQGTPQDHSKATMAPKIELEDCQIIWNKSALQLHNLVRGVMPEPGAWCYIMVRGEKKRLKIFKSNVIKSDSGSPGEIISYGKKGLVVKCAEDALQILELQLEGKKLMTSDEFMRGFQQNQLLFMVN